MDVQERPILDASGGGKKSCLGDKPGHVGRGRGRPGDIDRATILRLAEMRDECTGVAGATAKPGDPADHLASPPSFRIAACTAARWPAAWSIALRSMPLPELATAAI